MAPRLQLRTTGDKAPHRDRSPRRRAALPGAVDSTTGSYDVILRNLSCTGALAEGERMPPVGRDVLIEAGELQLFCRVVWAEPGRCGLEFDEPLPQCVVVALSNTVRDELADKRAAERDASAWARPEGRQAFLD